jgi:polysaccharide pyruvyl transferase WcaK-like protein
MTIATMITPRDRHGMQQPLTLPPLRQPVLVVGGYGYRNVGAEAMLAGLLEAMGDAQLTVVSRTPAETSALHGARSVPLTSAVSELRHHQTVVLGGGTLFGRDMGRAGRLLPPYGLLARFAGRHIVIAGVGLDEALPPYRARWVRQLARAADWVGVRDDRSAAVLAGWGVAVSVHSDLSVLIPSAPISAGSALLRSAGVSLRRPVIGLALTAVNRSLGKQVAAAVEGLARRLPGVELCFVPMSQHPFVASHNDLLFARDLQGRVPSLKVLEGTHHPAAILAVFSLSLKHNSEPTRRI